jgi:predicted amidophosphoribosyltransferase
MLPIKSVKRWVETILESLQNFLAPEEAKVQKILDLSPGVMRDLLPHSPVYMKDIIILFDYQNKVVRFLVKYLKYKNNSGLRKRIAGYLYEEIMEVCTETALFEGASPLLIPMPMSKKEKRNRGFNQCEELCMEIKKIGGRDVKVAFNLLQKIRETERQTKLSRGEREQNVKNSMAINKNLKKSSQDLAGYPFNNGESGQHSARGTLRRTVIVLDDVYTTGATFSEARRVLLDAGFSRVIGLFIAH